MSEKGTYQDYGSDNPVIADPYAKPSKVAKKETVHNAFAPEDCHCGAKGSRELRIVCTACGHSAQVTEKHTELVKDASGAVVDHKTTETGIPLYRRTEVEIPSEDPVLRGRKAKVEEK